MEASSLQRSEHPACTGSQRRLRGFRAPLGRRAGDIAWLCGFWVQDLRRLHPEPRADGPDWRVRDAVELVLLASWVRRLAFFRAKCANITDICFVEQTPIQRDASHHGQLCGTRTGELRGMIQFSLYIYLFVVLWMDIIILRSSGSTVVLCRVTDR